MIQCITPRRRGSYGIDAPYGPAFMAAVAGFEIFLAIVSTRKAMPLFAAAFVLAILCLYLHATLRGKFVAWADVLEKLNLRGDERILDMGCGRGAVLLLAAQHLTTGRAVGVDLWRSLDQSGNSADATRRNAELEGVADRVELHTANMMTLPFEDNSFDVVLSSLAIHNIPSSAGRAKAISEAVRVLRPGGRLLIADVRGTRRHELQLRQLGMNGVTRGRLGHFSRCGAAALAPLVTAAKPA